MMVGMMNPRRSMRQHYCHHVQFHNTLVMLFCSKLLWMNDGPDPHLTVGLHVIACLDPAGVLLKRTTY